MLYEIAVIQVPTEEQKKQGESEKLIIGPKAVIANSPQSAALAIAKDSDLTGVDFNRVEVLVRPFAVGPK